MAKKKGRGGGGQAGQHKLFSLGPTMSPGKSGTYGYGYVSFGHRAHARFWTVGAKASYGNGRLLDACFRVFACCAKKENFQLFHFVQPFKMVHFKVSLSTAMGVCGTVL